MKITRSREVYQSKIFNVAEVEAKDSSGFAIRRAIVRHPGSAVMLVLDERSRVLLVRQFRLPAGKNLWELPAGKIDSGEKPLQAAKRELVEETGYRARKWMKLVEYWPSPGFLSEKMHLFLATGITLGEATPMEDERIETRWFAQRELDALIRSGKIEDGKTLLGFLFWRSR